MRIVYVVPQGDDVHINQAQQFIPDVGDEVAFGEEGDKYVVAKRRFVLNETGRYSRVRLHLDVLP